MALTVSVLAIATASTAAAAAAPAGLASAARPRPAVVLWRKAGPGWAVAEYSATTLNPPVKGAETLYLTSPRGSKYPFYTWPASYTGRAYAPWDWSGDRRRVLLIAGAPTTRFHVEQVSLATGKVVSRFTLPSYVQPIGYTRPAGLSMLAVRRHSSNTWQLVRYSLTGQPLKVLASIEDFAQVIESPNGASVILGAARGLEQVASTGGVVRRFSAPVPVTSCDPVRWWNAGTVLAVCTPKEPPYDSRLWLFPVTGGKVTALTPQRGGHGLDQGDFAAWRLSTGRLYLQAINARGSLFIGRQWRNGTVHLVTVPGTAGDKQIVAGVGRRLLVQDNVFSDSGGSSLLWFDPITGAVRYVLHPPANVAGVEGVVPFAAH